jgi:hypothetical protein
MAAVSGPRTQNQPRILTDSKKRRKRRSHPNVEKHDVRMGHPRFRYAASYFFSAGFSAAFSGALIDNSSTSKMRVALGAMSAPAPRSP